MNTLEMQLDYPFGETLPALGETLEVAPGVRWLRMRLPFQLDHINLWLIRDRLPASASAAGAEAARDGWAIVDCGIADAAARTAWAQVFETGLGGLPVLRVILTHMHPDHIGLADWLTERWGVRLWVSATDYNAARMAQSGLTAIGGETAARFMASHGLTDPTALAQIGARTNHYARLVPSLPAAYRRLLGGERVRIGPHDWQCHAGYGHAPEHIALHDPALGVLVSGLLGLLFRRELDAHQTTSAMGESIAHLNALWLAGCLMRTRGADGVYRFSTG